MNVFTMYAIVIFVQLLYDEKSSQIVNGKKQNKNSNFFFIFVKKNKKNKKNQNLLRIVLVEII